MSEEIVAVGQQTTATRSAELYSVTANVNVRATASTQSERLSTLTAGEQVSVVDRDDGWVRVARDGIEVGWIYGGYIAPTPQS